MKDFGEKLRKAESDHLTEIKRQEDGKLAEENRTKELKLQEERQAKEIEKQKINVLDQFNEQHVDPLLVQINNTLAEGKGTIRRDHSIYDESMDDMS